MTYRRLILVACASAGLLAAVGSLATSIAAPKTDAGAVLASYDERDDDGHHEGYRHHAGDQDRGASNSCRGNEDDGACVGRGGAMEQPNATPPANGLFTSGSKPRAQTN